MASYIALFLLSVALAALVANAWITASDKSVRRRTDIVLSAVGAGMLACLLVLVFRLPVASLNLPFGPVPGMGVPSMGGLGAVLSGPPAYGLVIALSMASAPFMIAILFVAFAVGWVRPSRSADVGGLAALAVAALLCEDRLHFAGLLAALSIALWWSGRRREHPAGRWRGVTWPVLAIAGALGLCAGGDRPALLAVCAVALSVALTRSGAGGAWLGLRGGERRAGAWSGGIGLLAALALVWRVVQWTATPVDKQAGLPFVSAQMIGWLRDASTLDGGWMIALGALVAMIGAWRCVSARGLRDALTEIAFGQLGLIWIAAGLAALADGAALPALADQGRAAAWLLTLSAGLMRIAALCAFESLSERAGHDGFGRLGGLLWLMPRQGGVLGIAMLQTIALPPLAGFASAWMLWQTLSAAPAIGDLGLRCAMLVLAIVVAVAIAALGAGSVRTVALVLLGRPRTPRAAGAEDRGGTVLWLPGVPLLLLALIGLAPSLALRIRPGPALREFGGRTVSGAAYLPWVVALTMAIVGAALFALWRRNAPAAEAAWWEDGAPPPPPWLPFGDPQTQPGIDFLRPLPIARPTQVVLRRAVTVARSAGRSFDRHVAAVGVPSAGLPALLCVMVVLSLMGLLR